MHCKVACVIIGNTLIKFVFMEKNDFQKILDNAEAQMRKGVLEFAILLVIARHKAYANEIIASLRQVHLAVVEGTIYPLMSRLKNAGLLDYDWAESKAGPPRKYYSITSQGKKFLNSYEKQWQALEKSISRLRK